MEEEKEEEEGREEEEEGEGREEEEEEEGEMEGGQNKVHRYKTRVQKIC